MNVDSFVEKDRMEKKNYIEFWNKSRKSKMKVARIIGIFLGLFFGIPMIIPVSYMPVVGRIICFVFFLLPASLLIIYRSLESVKKFEERRIRKCGGQPADFWKDMENTDCIELKIGVAGINYLFLGKRYATFADSYAIYGDGVEVSLDYKKSRIYFKDDSHSYFWDLTITADNDRNRRTIARALGASEESCFNTSLIYGDICNNALYYICDVASKEARSYLKDQAEKKAKDLDSSDLTNKWSAHESLCRKYAKAVPEKADLTLAYLKLMNAIHTMQWTCSMVNPDAAVSFMETFRDTLENDPDICDVDLMIAFIKKEKVVGKESHLARIDSIPDDAKIGVDLKIKEYIGEWVKGHVSSGTCENREEQNTMTG